MEKSEFVAGSYAWDAFGARLGDLPGTGSLKCSATLAT